METMIIREMQDLTYLSWSLLRASSGTAGSFLKSTSDIGASKIYYKLSNYDAMRGVIGHECVNELIVDRLLSIFGIDHLHYQLVHAEIQVDQKKVETYLCASEDFKRPGEDKVALDVLYQLERNDGESPLEFCVRQGWGEYIYQMLVVDYLILNRDRHGANIEVLRDTKKKTLRLAPIFDHGLSLLFNCYDEDAARNFDILKDRPVQCFVGSRSTWENLKLIPPGELPVLTPLREKDREVLLEGMDGILGQPWLDKIWEMIWGRWKRYEDFCHPR